MLNTNKMVAAAFSVMNKINWVRFFEKTFLIANVSLEVVFRILFLTPSNANIDFSGQKLWWKTFTTKEAFSTTRRIELEGKKEFATTKLDLEYKIYVVHVTSFSSNPFITPFDSTPLHVHPFRRPQIFGLIAKKAPTKVLAKYSDYTNIFSPDLVSKLPEHTGINKHAIKLVNNQQPPYKPIYSLKPVELESLKAYNEINLVNRFIRPSKSPAGALILFKRKLDGLFRLCVNYQDLNNLMIKNWCKLRLVKELLDRLRRARRYTKLDFTSIYHQMRICKEDKWKTVFRTRYGHFKY